MKPFVDPILRPIDPPPFDDTPEPQINESDIPKDCFEPSSAEADPKDTDLNPVMRCPCPHSLKKKKSQTKNHTTKRQSAKGSTPEAIVIDNETVLLFKNFHSGERNSSTLELPVSKSACN